MSELNWTKQTPAQTGWYWLKVDDQYWLGLSESVRKALMVGVYKRGDEWWFTDPLDDSMDFPCEGNGRLWAGPLVPPV